MKRKIDTSVCDVTHDDFDMTAHEFYSEKIIFSLTPPRKHQKLVVSPANAFYDASSCNDKCKQVFSSNPESAFSA